MKRSTDTRRTADKVKHVGQGGLGEPGFIILTQTDELSRELSVQLAFIFCELFQRSRSIKCPSHFATRPQPTETIPKCCLDLLPQVINHSVHLKDAVAEKGLFGREKFEAACADGFGGGHTGLIQLLQHHWHAVVVGDVKTTLVSCQPVSDERGDHRKLIPS